MGDAAENGFRSMPPKCLSEQTDYFSVLHLHICPSAIPNIFQIKIKDNVMLSSFLNRKLYNPLTAFIFRLNWQYGAVWQHELYYGIEGTMLKYCPLL